LKLRSNCMGEDFYISYRLTEDVGTEKEDTVYTVFSINGSYEEAIQTVKKIKPSAYEVS
jgi:hypothetical protein